MAEKPTSGSVLVYRPQLDSARFIAVFIVLLYHQHFMFLQSAGRFFDLPTFIIFFFVLSSFLITRILLVSKETGIQYGFSRWKIASVFLFRRTIRIFPAYYFYLFLIMMLPVGGIYVRQHAASFYFYISNFQTYADQIWEGFSTHLWTLAVEEQFYLIWPWVILFIPNRFLPKVFFGMVIAGAFFRYFYFHSHPEASTEMVTFEILTPSCLDAFGFGAWLAYEHAAGKTRHPFLQKAFLICLPCWLLLKMVNIPAVSIVIDRLFVALFSLFLIEGSNNGFKNQFGRLLETRWMIYLGKISYGIYLYHLFIPFLFWKCFNKIASFLILHAGISLTGLAHFLAIPGISFLMYLISSIIFAALSWHFLEQPVNQLRKMAKYIGPSKNKQDAGLIGSKPLRSR